MLFPIRNREQWKVTSHRTISHVYSGLERGCRSTVALTVLGHLCTPVLPSVQDTVNRLAFLHGILPGETLLWCGMGNAHHFSQRTRGNMEEMNEDMHPPAPVGDSMIQFPRILTGDLTSLWLWQAAGHVSKAAHICLLHPLPEVMPV